MTTGRINQVAFFLDFGPASMPRARTACGQWGSGSHSYRGTCLEQTEAENPPRPLNFPHPGARATVLWTETATTKVRGYVRDTGTAIEVRIAAAEPQGGQVRACLTNISIRWEGNTGTKGRDQEEQAQSWGKNETDEGSTVRCPSKEPANPHNPNTTHTPITYAGHNTSKHARNPVQNENEAHKRIEWRHGRTAWRETSFQNEGQTGKLLAAP